MKSPRKKKLIKTKTGTKLKSKVKREYLKRKKELQGKLRGEGEIRNGLFVLDLILLSFSHGSG